VTGRWKKCLRSGCVASRQMDKNATHASLLLARAYSVSYTTEFYTLLWRISVVLCYKRQIVPRAPSFHAWRRRYISYSQWSSSWASRWKTASFIDFPVYVRCNNIHTLYATLKQFSLFSSRSRSLIKMAVLCSHRDGLLHYSRRLRCSVVGM